MNHAPADIVLPYRTSRAKQIFVLTFCIIAAIGLWIGAWASFRWTWAIRRKLDRPESKPGTGADF